MTVGPGRYDTRAPCRGDCDGRLRVKRIPISSVHRLRTPGKIPLEIIEVQSGRYLGEDDIERFEDVYSRSTPGIEAGVRTQTIAR